MRRIVLLWALGILTYATSLTSGFQLDDVHVIAGNPAIRTVPPIWRHFTDGTTMSSLPSNQSYRPLHPHQRVAARHSEQVRPGRAGGQGAP